MRRQFTALLVVLFLVPQFMVGCKSATEPSPGDDGYSAWVGTWVGSNASHQIKLTIWRGTTERTCSIVTGGCYQYAGLYYTADFSDARTGYSGSSTSFLPTQISGTSTSDTWTDWDSGDPALARGEVYFGLGDKAVTDIAGINWVSYTYRGTLQGSNEAMGNVIVTWWKDGVGMPSSTETLSVLLRKQ